MDLTEVIKQRNEFRAALRASMVAQEQACQSIKDTIETCNQYILAQIPTAAPELLMSMRFDALEDAAIISGRHKAELDAYNAEAAACEARIKEHMVTAKLQQFKTLDGHETHWTTKDSVSVKDMDTVVGFMIDAAPAPDPRTVDGIAFEPSTWMLVRNHIKSTGMWGLLNKVVNKTNAKSVLDTGVSPDVLGVKYDTFRDLVWKRGKE